MLGAIIGDMMGSIYEYKKPENKEIPRTNMKYHMTDDSYLTISVATILLKHYPFNFSKDSLKVIQEDLIDKFSKIVRGHMGAGWGASFFQWARLPPSVKKPYYSYGNGSAMRISPVGWMAKSEEEVKILSTHNHPEGLKGAEAIAMCIFLALNGKSKDEIRDYVIEHYYPQLVSIDYQLLLNHYEFDVSCQGSVPEAIYCFLISTGLEDAIKTAISIGGDADTIGAMAGSIAEAFYQKDALSDFEKEFLYMSIDNEVEDLVRRFHDAIHSKKFHN